MPAKNTLLSRSCLLLLCSIPLFLSAQTKEQRPNIIYIMADDLGYGDLSGYGRKDYQTPNLDKLAARGMKFTHAYAAAPVCTPTRTAFMTGRYPARTPVGLYEPLRVHSSDSLTGLTAETPSIATYLKAAGYATYLVGKWHLGFKPQFSPRQNGFDYFFGFHSGGLDYVSHRAATGKPPDMFSGRPDLYENSQLVERTGYMTDLLKEKALEIIQKPHHQPFFLALMFNAPHWPWQAPGDAAYADATPWDREGSASTYAAMIKSMDDAVGALLQALDRQGLARNTVVIFTSDNGGERLSDMGPYKGRKYDLWEGGIRVPAFVRWPGKIKEGSTTPQVAVTMDWTATILSLAEALPRQDTLLDGVDLVPVLTGQKKPTDRVLYWRLAQRKHHKALREGQWKYLQDEKGVDYLFNLDTDPGEKENLREAEAVRFTLLKKKYAQWEARMLKPVLDEQPR
jgi:arylsulfatase A-like enzyme